MNGVNPVRSAVRKQMPNGYTHHQALILVESKAHLKAYTDSGYIEWIERDRSGYSGECLVAALNIEGFPEMKFLINMHPNRKGSFSFVLTLGGKHFKRLDVNGIHQGAVYTHEQTVDLSREKIDYNLDAEAIELTQAKDFPLVEQGVQVSEKILERCWYAAASRFGIDIADVRWIAPPFELGR